MGNLNNNWLQRQVYCQTRDQGNLNLLNGQQVNLNFDLLQ